MTDTEFQTFIYDVEAQEKARAAKAAPLSGGVLLVAALGIWLMFYKDKK